MMKKAVFVYLLIAILNKSWAYAQPQKAINKTKSVNSKAIAELVLNRGLNSIDLGLYPGSLLMHGMSELTVNTNDEKMLNQAIAIFEDFKTKKIEGRGSFISYEAGGSGAAYLDFLDKTNTLSDQVWSHADKMFRNQKRSSEGILTANWAKDSLDQVFIDIAFAVSPYLLYTGLKYKKPEYVDAAVFETLELFKILKDQNGLIHQARGFNRYKVISEDNWSRGNGWGAFALAILARDLPDSHPRKKEVNELARSFFTAILKYQNQEGLWNQEMTEHTSYVETSGTGLMLFGLGICIEKGILDASHLPKFVRGLEGYMSYISDDGTVSNTCMGCLSPGQGTKKDYIARPWILNDHHAFGPVVLAFSQALKLGINNITPAKSMGCYVTEFEKPIKPQAFIRYMPEANENICWENDRIAFRVYGPPVKNRVSSGIDIWTKSVDYPIISKWYDQNNQGKSYHENHGEGLDFYHVAYGRGLGGTAIWRNEKPYISAPYATHKILKNTEDEVAFELNFDAWDADGIKVSEKKLISLKMGTNFCKVTSTFSTDSKEPLTVALGLSYTDKPEVLKYAKKGTLTLWEAFLPTNGELGTTLIVKPSQIKEFSEFEKEKYVVLKAKSGKPITYYVGTGWSKSKVGFTKDSWLNYVRTEVLKMQLY
jgi:rhamnogalacturonyl hydrolase YesR